MSDPYDLRTIEAKYMYGSYHRQGGGFGGYSGESASGGYSQGRNGETDLEARYYAVLGLEKGAGMEEIKKAYRKLSDFSSPKNVTTWAKWADSVSIVNLDLRPTQR